MQLGFYFDRSKCIGCFACVAACRGSNCLEAEMPDIIKLDIREKGEFPDVKLNEVLYACFHCENPVCVSVCPAEIFKKRGNNGVVVLENPENCSGCRLCSDVCPYGAPKVIENNSKVSIYKCDLCSDRRGKGERPACVAACPMGAIDIAPMEDLLRKHGGHRSAEGYPDYHETRPSLILNG